MCLYVCVIGLRFYLFLWNGCCFMTEDLFALLFEGRKVKVVVCGCWVSLNHNEVFDLKFAKFYIQKSIVSLKVQWFRVRFVWWLSLLNFFVSVCECVCVVILSLQYLQILIFKFLKTCLKVFYCWFLKVYVFCYRSWFFSLCVWELFGIPNSGISLELEKWKMQKSLKAFDSCKNYIN